MRETLRQAQGDWCSQDAIIKHCLAELVEVFIDKQGSMLIKIFKLTVLVCFLI